MDRGCAANDMTYGLNEPVIYFIHKAGEDGWVINSCEMKRFANRPTLDIHPLTVIKE